MSAQPLTPVRQTDDTPLPTADAVALGAHAAQSKPPLTLFQANLLVAMLGGFWARKADGHPGPDLLGRGLVILNVLVAWERIKAQTARKGPLAKQPRGKPG